MVVLPAALDMPEPLPLDAWLRRMHEWAESTLSAGGLDRLDDDCVTHQLLGLLLATASSNM
jgi:hypothetical protein